MRQDRYGIIYAIVCLLGVATLLPWNILITETQYFDVRAHVKPCMEHMANDLKAVMPVAFQIANFCALALFIHIQTKLTVDHQVLYPLCVTLLLVIVIAAIAAMPSLSGNFLMLTTLPGCAVLGVTSAILAGGVYSMAAPYGPTYIQAAMTGQALAGVAVALLSFVTQASSRVDQSVPSPAAVSRPAFKYFTGSAGVVLAAILGYLHVRARVKRSAALSFELDAPLLVGSDSQDSERLHAGIGAPHNGGGLGGAPDSPRDGSSWQDGLRKTAGQPQVVVVGERQRPGKVVGSCGHHEVAVEKDMRAAEGRGSGASQGMDILESGSRGLSVGSLLRLLWGYCVVVVANFCVTLIVFPAVTSSVCSQYNPAVQHPGQYTTCAATTAKGRFYGDLFVPFSFVLFNAGDVVGRLLTSLGPWRLSPPPVYIMMVYALLRLPCAIALLYCNVVTPLPWRVPAALRSDWCPLALVSVFGLTNGHLGMVALMHAPAAIPKQHSGRCGPIMSFCVVCGCILGSLISFLLLDLLQIHPV